jgi:hypothetical protein
MKRTRQQKAKRVMEISNKRMLKKLHALGIKPTLCKIKNIDENASFETQAEDAWVRTIPHPRDTYVKIVGVDRLVRAWDLASIIL